MKKRLLSLAAVFAGLIVAPSHLQAIIESIALRVDGTQCQFCMQSIGKRLLELKGVKRISLVGKSVHLQLTDNNTFNTSILKKTIEKNTHYSIKDIKITATGKIDKKSKFYIFEVDNSPEKIYLGELGAIEKPVDEESIEKNSKKNSKKKQRGSKLVDSSKKFWSKTTGFIGSWFAGITPTREELDRLYKKNKDVRFTGNAHFHADQALWISGRGAIIKEIKTAVPIEKIKMASSKKPKEPKTEKSKEKNKNW